MLSKEMYNLGSARSAIRELFEYGRLKALECGPENVMDFSLGNPSIPAPKEVEDAILKLIKEESPTALHGYTSAVGDNNARTSIAESLNRRYNSGLAADNLFIIGGAAPAVISCLKALTESPNSEFITIAPYFPEYKVYIENGAGAVMRVVPADTESFQINFPALEEIINPNTCGIIINSPNNPSGVVYTLQTLERLSKLLEEKSKEFDRTIYLISDEPYRELVYGGVEVPYVPAVYKNTLICYSYSKSLSLPGERIGYVVVPPSAHDWQNIYLAVAGAARAIGHVCAPSLMQKVAGLCCDVAPDLSIYERNSTLLYDRMTQIGYNCAKPDGAFYLFFGAPNGLSGKDFSDLAKDKYNLLAVPGDSFGCPDHIRMSYCVPTERIEKALPFLEELFEISKAK